jgi:hypothetical protein
MNLLRTMLFFGLLMTMLWVFGLMAAYKRLVPDESRIVPTLESADAKVDGIEIKNKDEQVVLARENDTWYLKKEGQKVKLEGFKVDQLVGQVKKAQKSDEFTPSDDLGFYGLAPAQTTVLLKGKFKGQDKEWKLFLGKASPDKKLVYANSSDRPDKAYGVSRESIDSLFKDANLLRPRRLLDFSEAAANRIDLKKGATEIELKRGTDNYWHFEKPALGFAGFDSPSPTAVGGDPKAASGGGVKGLLGTISGLHVDADDDFVNPGQPLSRYGLEDGKEALRIEVDTAGSGEKKEGSREVLLVGKRVPGREQVYVRVLGDDGVEQISLKQIEAIDKALADPAKIRSRDLSALDPKSADLVTLQQGADEVKLSKAEGQQDWKLQAGSGPVQKANGKAVQSLLDAVQGKNAILTFYDPPAAEQQKFDEEWGLAKAATILKVFTAAVDKEGKEKKDAKPAVTLGFGKVDGEVVYVKRTLPDGTVSRFALVKAILEKVRPEEGAALAYLDPTLPSPPIETVTEIELKRGHDKLTLVKEKSFPDSHWYIKDPSEPSGRRLADAARVNAVLGVLHQLQAKKWVEKIGPKTDLAKFGLKSPDVSVTLVAKTDRVPPAAIASVFGLLGAREGGLAAVATALYHGATDRGLITTFSFGKETEEGHFKASIYAKQSGGEAIFLVQPEVVKLLRDVDFRDRAVVLNTQPSLDAGAVAGGPSWLLASPLVTGSLHHLDPAKVKELKISLRTPAELRTFAFRRADKSWQDASGLQEFQLDSERVNQLVDKLAQLKTNRLVVLSGGPRADQKLTPKEAALRLELTTDDGKTITLWVGAEFERQGYFATSSAWPEVVFLVPAALVEPVLQAGVGYFAKERVAAAR